MCRKRVVCPSQLRVQVSRGVGESPCCVQGAARAAWYRRVREGEPCVGRNASHSALVTPLQHFSAPTGRKVCAGCLGHCGGQVAGPGSCGR